MALTTGGCAYGGRVASAAANLSRVRATRPRHAISIARLRLFLIQTLQNGIWATTALHPTARLIPAPRALTAAMSS